MLTAVAAMVVNVAGDLTLGVRYGVPGLAASTSLSVLLAAVLLSGLAAHRHQSIDLRRVGRTLLAVSAAAAGSAVAGWGVLQALPFSGPVGALGALAAVGVACLVTYAVSLVVLREPALADLRAALRDLR